jgi:hypothetical protein
MDKVGPSTRSASAPSTPITYSQAGLEPLQVSGICGRCGLPEMLNA